MIVTISREYGAAGLAVADGVAHALGYELVTDEVLRRAAVALGTSPAVVESRTSDAQSLTERMLAELGEATVESVSVRPPPGEEFERDARREVERAIRERAARGDVVILGRGAGAILGARPDCLRVFLWADVEWRIARLMTAFGKTRAETIAEIERVDGARRKASKERFKLVWGDARAYDLTIGVSHAGIEGAAALIAQAVTLAATRA